MSSANDNESWLRVAHSRVILNTLNSIRELHEKQCIQRMNQPNVSEALQQSILPLAFLSDAAQLLPLDLEVVWRRHFQELSSSQSAPAVMRVGRAGKALAALEVFPSAENLQDEVGQTIRDQSGDYEISNSDDGGSSLRKRLRDVQDEDSVDAVLASLPPSMRWIAALDDPGCVHFAKSCLTHHRRLSSNDLNKAIRIAELKASSNGTPVRGDLPASALPTAATASTSNAPTHRLAVVVPTHATSKPRLVVPDVRIEQVTSWVEVTLASDDNALEAIAASYEFPSDLNVILSGEIGYLDGHIAAEDAVGITDLQIPSRFGTATLRVVGRGEFAARRGFIKAR